MPKKNKKHKSAESETESLMPSQYVTWLVFAYIAVMLSFTLWVLVRIWPDGSDEQLTLCTFSIHTESRYLLAIITSGTIGALSETAYSFIRYVGTRQFRLSWAMWYLLKPLIGASLALVIYLLVRGGFFAGSAQPQDINLFGLAGLACLAGLNSKEMLEKLESLAKQVLITPQADQKRLSDDLKSEDDKQ